MARWNVKPISIQSADSHRRFGVSEAEPCWTSGMNEGRCKRNEGTHKGCPYNITVGRGGMRLEGTDEFGNIPHRFLSDEMRTYVAISELPREIVRIVGAPLVGARLPRHPHNRLG